MTATLANILGGIAPPDTSGSTASNRFAVQISWLICRMLDLHGAGENFNFILDYYDDILQLNCKDNPTEIAFFQIKTKDSGNWTAAALIRQKNGATGKLPSILGKMWRNRFAFASCTVSTTFVSNARFSVKLQSGKKSVDFDRIKLSDLEANELNRIETQVAAENNQTTPIPGSDSTHLTVTQLPTSGHDMQALGLFTNFLDAKVPGHASPAPLYKTLRFELERKSNCEGVPVDYSDLCEKKSFCRDDLAALLTLPVRANITKLIERLRADLIAEQCPLYDRINYEKSCSQYLIDRMDSTNTLIETASAVVGQSVREHIESNTLQSLREVVRNVQPKVQSDLNELCQAYGPHFIPAMICIACYEQPPLSTPDPKSAPETR